jgi:hypothetical protein
MDSIAVKPGDMSAMLSVLKHLMIHGTHSSPRAGLALNTVFGVCYSLQKAVQLRVNLVDLSLLLRPGSAESVRAIP